MEQEAKWPNRDFHIDMVKWMFEQGIIDTESMIKSLKIPGGDEILKRMSDRAESEEAAVFEDFELVRAALRKIIKQKSGLKPVDRLNACRALMDLLSGEGKIRKDKRNTGGR